MAGEFVTLVLDAVMNVEPSAKLVLVALADHANRRDGGRTYPSNAMLAHRSCLKERQVRDWLRELEAQGWVERIAYSAGGRGMATVYRLNLAQMVSVMNVLGGDEQRKKAAAHCRVLQKLPGALPLGFLLSTCASSATDAKPGSLRHETRQSCAQNPAVERPPTSYEPLEPEVEPERAREAAAISNATAKEKVNTVLQKLKGKPEGRRQQMSPDEQRAWAARVLQNPKAVSNGN